MNYKGMNAKTGRAVYDTDHLTQSVQDILLTPQVSRVMRRDYGSGLFNLIDQAGNAAMHLRLYAAIATALLRFEPRLQLSRIQITANSNGQHFIDIDGVFISQDQRKAVSITAPLGAQP